MNIFKSKKRIYLDHASSTPIDPRVERAVSAASLHAYANPSSLHKEGIATRAVLEDARRSVVTFFDVHADEIIFTSGATESDNLALFGVLEAYRMNNRALGEHPHIILSSIEHSAVREHALFVEKQEVDVTFIPVDEYGLIDMKALKESITPRTIFISVMYANNEIGTIEPITEIAKLIRHYKKHNALASPYPLFHIDATQAINYLPTRIPPLGVDLLTCNGSKIYGPKGVGILYKRRGIPFAGQLKGGDQEMGFRPGTENVPAIAGFAKALEIVAEMKDKESSRLAVLKEFFLTELKKQFPAVIINGHETLSLPNIVNFTLPHIESDYLVLSLDARGFAVSSKSACKSDDERASHVIMNLRKGTDSTDGSLRVSFGRSTKKQYLISFLRALHEVVVLHEKAVTILKGNR